MSIVFTSFKHTKLPISIKIPETLLQIVYICMPALSPYSSSNVQVPDKNMTVTPNNVKVPNKSIVVTPSNVQVPD